MTTSASHTQLWAIDLYSLSHIQLWVIDLDSLSHIQLWVIDLYSLSHIQLWERVRVRVLIHFQKSSLPYRFF
jgi:hypothetical protein